MKKILCLASVCLAVLIGFILMGKNPSAKKSSVKLNKSSVKLYIGKKCQLKLKQAKGKVTWKSQEPKIASVSKNGKVTAKSEGETKITAKAKGKTYTCKVTVLKKASQDTDNDQTDNTSDCGDNSGSEECYNRYFNVDMKEYTKKAPDDVIGQIEEIHYYSSVVGTDREAYVYTPNGYSADKEYPVLYMLHGIGCDKGQWVSMSLNNILSNMIAAGEVVPFVAVIPSVIPKDGVNPETLSAENINAYAMFHEEFKKDLEPFVFEHYSVSRKRENTGICGLSMGGMEALNTGFRHLDTFNYIGSFSPAPTLDTSLLTTKNSPYVPALVLLCTGTADDTVGDNPYNYHKVLTENHVEHIWYQYPKGRHSDNVWKNGLVNFLKRAFK